MSKKIVLIQDGSKKIIGAYRHLSVACEKQGINYNTVTCYFRRNPTKTTYKSKTGITLTKTTLK